MLTDLIISKSRERALSSDQPDLKLLLQKKELWESKHFQRLAEDMGWSATNLKRLFGLPGHNPPKSLSVKSEQILCEYLGFESWDQLQQKLIEQATNPTPVHEELHKVVFRIGKKLHEIEAEYQQLIKFLKTKPN